MGSIPTAGVSLSVSLFFLCNYINCKILQPCKIVHLWLFICLAIDFNSVNTVLDSVLSMPSPLRTKPTLWSSPIINWTSYRQLLKPWKSTLVLEIVKQHLPRTPSCCRSKDMPCQLGAEMPDDCQLFVLIDVVKSSAMNKPEKRPGLTHIKKSFYLSFHLDHIFFIQCWWLFSLTFLIDIQVFLTNSFWLSRLVIVGRHSLWFTILDSWLLTTILTIYAVS